MRQRARPLMHDKTTLSKTNCTHPARYAIQSRCSPVRGAQRCESVCCDNRPGPHCAEGPCATNSPSSSIRRSRHGRFGINCLGLLPTRRPYAWCYGFPTHHRQCCDGSVTIGALRPHCENIFGGLKRSINRNSTTVPMLSTV